MFRWEGDFQVSVPSACLFLGGLKGEIWVLFKLLKTFPQLQYGQYCTLPPPARNAKCEMPMDVLLSCIHSIICAWF